MLVPLRVVGVFSLRLKTLKTCVYEATWIMPTSQGQFQTFPPTGWTT